MNEFHNAPLTRTVELATERRDRSIDAAVTGPLDPRVSAAPAHIRSHCTRGRLSVRAVARAAHTSPWHLTRMVRRQTGLSLHAHIRTARLRIVLTLLESPWLSVKEVAAQTSYRSAGELSRDFRRTFDMSPSEWRRRIVRRRHREVA